MVSEAMGLMMTPTGIPTPPPLTPIRIQHIRAKEYHEILQWTFPSDPFFVEQVGRSIAHDVPQFFLLGNRFTLWGYRDAQVGQQLVGFGCHMIADYYCDFTNGVKHCYIPLLSVNPGIQSRGYGRAIVEHLVAVAQNEHAQQPLGTLSDYLFLDVYTANDRAIKLYEKCQFTILNKSNPIPDPDENQEPYYVMASHLTASTSSPTP